MTNKHTKYGSLMKAFGKAVRFYRNRLRFSQESLADRAQLDRSYMSQIERGIKNATLNSIWRISKALEVMPSQLLALTEEVDKAGEEGDALLKKRASESQDTATAQSDSIAAKSKGPRVLVVDDDQDICGTVAGMLRASGFEAQEAASGLEAMRLIAIEPIDALISDVRMANGNGLELLESVRKHYPDMPVFFITGYDDITAEDAIRRGATGIFNKPFDMSSFIRSVKSSLPEGLN